MIRRRHRPSIRRIGPRRRIEGDGAPAGLIVGLHGYGADERQLETLLPFEIPVIVVHPRAGHVVDPGFGWWLPERVDDGSLELAPSEAVDLAVARTVEIVTQTQREEAVPPERTALVGYSQGATLALSVAARYPELVSTVVAGAGFLLPDEHVEASSPIEVLVMNGTLDPVVDEHAHTETLERFARAGHRVVGRRDAVPHVIDRAQVPVVNAFVAESLGVSGTAQWEPGVPMSISAPRRRWVARPPTSRSNTTR